MVPSFHVLLLIILGLIPTHTNAIIYNAMGGISDPTSANYNKTWTFATYAPLTITINDQIDFRYTGTHTVDLFTGGDCECDHTTGSVGTCTPTVTLVDGKTQTYLWTPSPSVADRTVIFLCAATFHCAGGMKLYVTVGPTASPTATPSFAPSYHHCADLSKDVDETDVDCGGPTCLKRCTMGQNCTMDSDCQSVYCDTSTNTCGTSRPSHSPSHAPSIAPTVSWVSVSNNIPLAYVGDDFVSYWTLHATKNVNAFVSSVTVNCSTTVLAPWLASINASSPIPLSASSPAVVSLGQNSVSLPDSYPGTGIDDAGGMTFGACLHINATLQSQSLMYTIPVSVQFLTWCGIGTSNPQGSNQFVACTSCTYGTYANSTGQTSCFICPDAYTRTMSTASTSISDCIQCPIGSYCPVGVSTPQLCPELGGYETLAGGALKSRSAADCENVPCQVGYWCGAGAAENSTYRLVPVFGKMDTMYVVREVTETTYFRIPITNMHPTENLLIRMTSSSDSHGVITGISNSATGPLVDEVSIPPGSTTSQVLFLGIIPNSIPSSITVLTANVSFEWKLAVTASDYFTGMTLPVQIDTVTVAISPDSEADYSLLYGQQYPYTDSGSNSLQRFAIFNSLCTSDLYYTVIPHNDTSIDAACGGGPPTKPWFSFTNAILTENLIPSGRPNPDFIPYSLSLVPTDAFSLPQSDYTFASKVSQCFTLSIRLAGLGVTISRHLKVSVVVKQLCRPGWFSSTTTDELGCHPCPKNTYQDESGNTGCKPCPPPVVNTLNDTANSVELCVAPPGQFQFSTGSNSTEPCPTGAICDEGATLCTILVKPGLWRTSCMSTDIRSCFRTNYCPGGGFPTTSSGGKRRQLDSSTTAHGNMTGALCIPNHRGILCEQCVAGYVKRGPLHICSLCTSENNAADVARVSGILVGISIATFILGVIVYYWLLNGRSKQGIGHAQSKTGKVGGGGKLAGFNRFFHMVDIGVKLKIIFGLLQVLSGMAGMFALQLPSFYQNLSNFFSVMSFDLVELLDFGCVLEAQDFFTGLLFVTLLPVLVSILLLGSHMILERIVRRSGSVAVEELRTVSFTILLMLIFVVYPSVSTTVLEVFSCTAYDNGVWALTSDPSITCYDSRYNTFLGYAIFCVLVYPVGIPLFYLWLLRRERNQIDPSRVSDMSAKVALAVRNKNRMIYYLRFLFHPYKPRFYWYEFLEMLRKLAQTSIVVFISSTGIDQMIFQVVITVISIVVMNTTLPYVEMPNNVLGLVSQWIIFTISFLSLLVKLGDENRAALYPDLSPSDDPERVTLQNAMVGLFFVAPALAVVQIFVEVMTDEFYRDVFWWVNWDDMWRNPRVRRAMFWIDDWDEIDMKAEEAKRKSRDATISPQGTSVLAVVVEEPGQTAAATTPNAAKSVVFSQEFAQVSPRAHHAPSVEAAETTTENKIINDSIEVESLLADLANYERAAGSRVRGLSFTTGRTRGGSFVGGGTAAGTGGGGPTPLKAARQSSFSTAAAFFTGRTGAGAAAPTLTHDSTKEEILDKVTTALRAANERFYLLQAEFDSRLAQKTAETETQMAEIHKLKREVYKLENSLAQAAIHANEVEHNAAHHHTHNPNGSGRNEEA